MRYVLGVAKLLLQVPDIVLGLLSDRRAGHDGDSPLLILIQPEDAVDLFIAGVEGFGRALLGGPSVYIILFNDSNIWSLPYCSKLGK